jgi:hypothetical protein
MIPLAAFEEIIDRADLYAAAHTVRSADARGR